MVITGVERTYSASPGVNFRTVSLLLLLLLPLFSCAPSQVKNWEGSTITGQVQDARGKAVAGAHVYAYQEGTFNTLGPAEAMSEPTTGNGKYLLILPRGSYILVARKRLSGSISGPMKNGDMSGQLSRPLSAVGDVTGNIDITMRIFSQGAEGDPKRILTTDTRITGTVMDSDGAVLSGVNVFAYEGSFRQEPPDYLAPVTDNEGRFEISLPGAGTYTLGARTGLGGKPGPGESIGFWGERDRPREIKGGTVVQGVRIVVVPYGDTGPR